jgi:Skp family chaperone for outer membrane proteins
MRGGPAMKKMALCSIIFLIANSIVFAQASGAQVLTPEKEKLPGLQSDNSKCVRIAVIDSQRAFELSTEGQKLSAMVNKMAKKKQEEEIRRIRSEMIVIVQKIAIEKGYGLILDLKTSGVIYYFVPVDDITDELINRYNSSKH